MGPVGGVGHVSAACGASPVVSGLPLLPLHLLDEERGKGVNVHHSGFLDRRTQWVVLSATSDNWRSVAGHGGTGRSRGRRRRPIQPLPTVLCEVKVEKSPIGL